MKLPAEPVIFKIIIKQKKNTSFYELKKPAVGGEISLVRLR